MKKFILSFLTVLGLGSILFAESSTNRYFELKFDTGVSVSNNALNISDYLVKDCVIDFTKIANNLPASGYNVTMSGTPQFGLSIDVPGGIILGTNAGVNVYGSSNISKSLFDFFGNGHDFTQEETLTISCDDTYVDVFAFVDTSLGFNFDKLRLKLTPSIYSTIAHATVDKADLKVKNTNSGDFGYELSGQFSVYSSEALTSTDNLLGVVLGAKDNLGVDFSTEVEYYLFDSLSIFGSCRVPIVASCPTVRTVRGFKSALTTNIADISSGEMGSVGFNFTDPEISEASYAINRPMKFNIGACFSPISDYMPIGNLFTCYGSVGFGVKHPFSTADTVQGAYMDYKLGAKLSLWDILNLYVSTERADELYIQKATLGFNLRILELDVGVGSVSNTYASSLKGSGLAMYVTACMGF